MLSHECPSFLVTSLSLLTRRFWSSFASSFIRKRRLFFAGGCKSGWRWSSKRCIYKFSHTLTFGLQPGVSLSKIRWRQLLLQPLTPASTSCFNLLGAAAGELARIVINSIPNLNIWRKSMYFAVCAARFTFRAVYQLQFILLYSLSSRYYIDYFVLISREQCFYVRVVYQGENVLTCAHAHTHSVSLVDTHSHTYGCRTCSYTILYLYSILSADI